MKPKSDDAEIQENLEMLMAMDVLESEDARELIENLDDVEADEDSADGEDEK